MIYTEEAGISRIREYINSVYWKFAKSMPKFPHEYTVRDWRHDKEDDFVFFVEHIRRYGKERRFFSKTYIYYHIDGYDYWTMGNNINETKIINRVKA